MTPMATRSCLSSLPLVQFFGGRSPFGGGGGDDPFSGFMGGGMGGMGGMPFGGFGGE